MKDKKNFAAHLDFLGFTVSFLCAFHCIALPFLATLGSLSSLRFLDNNGLEAAIILLSLLLALSSLLPSYFRKHKKPQALALMFLGFSLIGLSHLILPEQWEVLATSLAAITIAYAHYLNWKLLKVFQKKA